MGSAYLSLALLVALSALGSGFVPQRRLAAVGRTQRRAVAPVLMAKSKKPSRKKGRSKAAKEAASQELPPMMDEPPRPSVPTASFSAPVSDPGASRSERLDSVLRAAGLSQSDSAVAEAARPNDAPLASIPLKGQELLEKFFGSGAILFGSIFLVSGIGVSIEATCKILKVDLPVPIAEAIVQYVEPALTPSILILFAFSISLGLLKQVTRRPLAHPSPAPFARDPCPSDQQPLGRVAPRPTGRAACCTAAANDGGLRGRALSRVGGRLNNAAGTARRLWRGYILAREFTLDARCRHASMEDWFRPHVWPSEDTRHENSSRHQLMPQATAITQRRRRETSRTPQRYSASTV